MSFNYGSAAVGMAVGESWVEGVEIRKRVDRKRLALSITTIKEKEEIKERKIGKVQEE